MPSVEMRRSTRVFVPKAKDGGLVKVLRSGRRLWGDPAVEKSVPVVRDNDGDWFKLKPSITPSLAPPKDRFEEKIDNNCKDESMDVDDVEKAGKVNEETVKELDKVYRSEVRVVRNVYSRKRKQVSENSNGGRKKQKFGLHYVRRKNKICEKTGVFGDKSRVFSIVIASCSSCSVVSRLLASLLRNLANGGVGLTQISGFLVSVPVKTVFESSGIQFLLNRPCMINRVCRISLEDRQRTTLFTIDFAAIPLCFLYLHATLSLRGVFNSLWMIFFAENETIHDENKPHQCIDSIDSLRDEIVSVPVAPDRDDEGKKIVVAGLEAGRVGGSFSSRIVQFRSCVLTRSSSERRRRSLRNRRARNPSHFVMQKSHGHGPPVFNNSMFKKKSLEIPSVRVHDLRRSTRKNHENKISPNSVLDLPNSISSPVDSNHSCCVNVLVVETDRCYRIKEAEVSLDLSPSNEWILSVKKDGVISYCLKAQKEMKLPSFNRFTHDVQWTSKNGLKLEFPDRNEWLVFKELYKLCGERNIVPSSPVVKNIPVPGVTEVADFWDEHSTGVFQRPESYIRTNSDKLSRIISRKTANYDMDSDDNDWLNELNSGLDDGNCVSEEIFELLIDAFEKAYYFNPEGVNDFDDAVSICQDLASAEVIVPLYRYWNKRREERRAPLLKVFELNEPRKAQLITKPVLRKRRSLKRATTSQSLQRERGKDSNILQAMAVERTIIEEQHTVVQAQEARASADKLADLAIEKRQRAQILMENADLAIYRATMAMRVAEAAVDSPKAASLYLDDDI